MPERSVALARFAIRVMGDITRVARKELHRELEAGTMLPGASPNGRMAYVSGAMAMLAWIDRAAADMTKSLEEGKG